LAVKMHGDHVDGSLGTGQVEVARITSITANTYTAKEILLTEGDMVTTLQWNLNPPIAPQFIDVLTQIYDFGLNVEKISQHAMYLSELTLLNAQLSSESKVAIGVCCMAVSDVLLGEEILCTVPRASKDFFDHWGAAVRASENPPNMVYIGELILDTWRRLELSFQGQMGFCSGLMPGAIRSIRTRHMGDSADPGAAEVDLPTKEQVSKIMESLSAIQAFLESGPVAQKRRRRKGRGNRRRGNGRGKKWDTES